MNKNARSSRVSRNWFHEGHHNGLVILPKHKSYNPPHIYHFFAALLDIALCKELSVQIFVVVKDE